MKWLRCLAAAAVAVLCTATASMAEVPALKGRVNDYANVLTDEEETALDGKLATIESYDKHPQVVILTVDTIGEQDMADYALEVGRTWGIGQKDENNGVLIVIATTDRIIDIEIGYGLEGAIPDAKAFAIRTHVMNPLLSEGKEQWAAALSGATDSIATLIRGEYTGNELIDNAEALAKAQREAALQMFLLGGGIIAGLLGYAHLGAAGAAGSVTGAAFGLVFSYTWWLVVVFAVIGFPLGILAHIFMLAKMGGGSGSFGGSSSGGGGFRGGGGSFGGGGSRGGF